MLSSDEEVEEPESGDDEVLLIDEAGGEPGPKPTPTMMKGVTQLTSATLKQKMCLNR